jgi:hypothetical protein
MVVRKRTLREMKKTFKIPLPEGYKHYSPGMVKQIDTGNILPLVKVRRVNTRDRQPQLPQRNGKFSSQLFISASPAKTNLVAPQDHQVLAPQPNFNVAMGNMVYSQQQQQQLAGVHGMGMGMPQPMPCHPQDQYGQVAFTAPNFTAAPAQAQGNLPTFTGFNRLSYLTPHYISAAPVVYNDVAAPTQVQGIQDNFVGVEFGSTYLDQNSQDTFMGINGEPMAQQQKSLGVPVTLNDITTDPAQGFQDTFMGVNGEPFAQQQQDLDVSITFRGYVGTPPQDFQDTFEVPSLVPELQGQSTQDVPMDEYSDVDAIVTPPYNDGAPIQELPDEYNFFDSPVLNVQDVADLLAGTTFEPLAQQQQDQDIPMGSIDNAAAQPEGTQDISAPRNYMAEAGFDLGPDHFTWLMQSFDDDNMRALGSAPVLEGGY